MKKISTKTASIFISSAIIFAYSCVTVFAATTNITGCNPSSLKDFKSLITVSITCLLNPIVILMVSLAIGAFVFGVFKIIASNSVEDKENGRQFIFWGIIGIFVMLSLWGLVNILKGTFVLTDFRTPRPINISL